MASPAYIPYLVLTVGVPVLALVAAGSLRRRDALGLAVLVPIALAYAAPWDSFLVRQGVWQYGRGTVVATAWSVPLGEYLFIVTQPVLTGLWLSRLADRVGPAGDRPTRTRLVGAGAGFAVTLAGAALLTRPATYYLGAILAWAGPVLAVQWAFDWPYLWRRRRTVAVAVAVPTAYLCLVDRVAIAQGLWTLSPQYTTGLAIGGLPVEEATFFLVTNVFVVQGLVLFRGLLARSDLGLAGPAAERPRETTEG